MIPNRWRQIEHVCHAAAARRGADRAAFLDAACGDDLDLRREVESLLAEEAWVHTFLESPAWPAARPGKRPPARCRQDCPPND